MLIPHLKRFDVEWYLRVAKSFNSKHSVWVSVQCVGICTVWQLVGESGPIRLDILDVEWIDDVTTMSVLLKTLLFVSWYQF